MNLSTEQLKKFLEILNKAPENVEAVVNSKDSIVEKTICEIAIIAPQAVRELIEARELLCNHLIELQECRKTLSSYGHSSNWMAEIDRLIKRTREYLGE